MAVVPDASEIPLDPSSMSIVRPARLAGLVDCLWHSSGVIPEPRERVLPNGSLELVLAFGRTHREVQSDGLREIPHTSFGGLQSRSVVLDHPPHCDTLGIVLRPAGAYALLARPLSEVSERMLDARDLLGAAADELFHRCAELPTAARRFALVTQWLGDRFRHSTAPHPAIAWMAAEIERAGSEARVGLLRKETGLSKARVVAAFREQIGVRPKLYARLVRFRSVLEQFRLGAGGRLIDVALDAGYYDQAHMNAEFREFAGISPSEFLLARYPEGVGNTAREPGPAHHPRREARP